MHVCTYVQHLCIYVYVYVCVCVLILCLCVCSTISMEATASKASIQKATILADRIKMVMAWLNHFIVVLTSLARMFIYNNIWNKNEKKLNEFLLLSLPIQVGNCSIDFLSFSITFKQQDQNLQNLKLIKMPRQNFKSIWTKAKLYKNLCKRMNLSFSIVKFHQLLLHFVKICKLFVANHLIP